MRNLLRTPPVSQYKIPAKQALKERSMYYTDPMHVQQHMFIGVRTGDHHISITDLCLCVSFAFKYDQEQKIYKSVLVYIFFSKASQQRCEIPPKCI